MKVTVDFQGTLQTGIFDPFNVNNNMSFNELKLNFISGWKMLQISGGTP